MDRQSCLGVRFSLPWPRRPVSSAVPYSAAWTAHIEVVTSCHKLSQAVTSCHKLSQVVKTCDAVSPAMTAAATERNDDDDPAATPGAFWMAAATCG